MYIWQLIVHNLCIIPNKKMCKLISLLSFSVVNKTIHNNRAAVLCLRDVQYVQKSVTILRINWPICGEGDKSETVIFSLCPPCTVLCSAVHVLERAVLALSPEPPAVEDMFSVCLPHCIFNELRLLSVFYSMGLNDANEKSYTLHIVLSLGSINNNVTEEIMDVCEGFLQLKQEQKLL